MEKLYVSSKIKHKNIFSKLLRQWCLISVVSNNFCTSFFNCCINVAAAAKSLQSCPTLCDPIDGSPPGSPVPGILQARTLEWVAIAFSNAGKWKVKVKPLSRIRPLATPWTVAYQVLHPRDFQGKSAMIRDINYRKKTLKNTNTWWLNNTFLNNEFLQFTEDIREIKTFLETKNNENTMIKNLEMQQKQF